MRLAKKWREYAGPKDERLEAENAKIYKLGFMLLSFGMLMLLVYQIMAQQVAWVHDGVDEAFRLFANPVDTVMYAWLFIVMIVCAVLQTRKGYVDTNRFRQTEHIPVGYFLLISGITGIASTLAIAAMRFIAEIQLVPIDGVFWGANLATGVGFGVVIFAAVFGALCLAFFEAKRGRAKIEAKLDFERSFVVRHEGVGPRPVLGAHLSHHLEAKRLFVELDARFLVQHMGAAMHELCFHVVPPPDSDVSFEYCPIIRMHIDSSA